MGIERFIDHTCLKSDATRNIIEKLCQEALEYHFHSVCINPYYVQLVSSLLKNSSVKVCTVVGFPLGSSTLEIKKAEAADAVRSGANEIDMVMNVSAFKDGDYDYVKREIKSLREAIGKDVCLKVIIEICLLSLSEIETASKLVRESGADFVKTSTGFSTSGANAEAVRIMRKAVGDDFGVKAAGGIRTYKDLLSMIETGANRIGCSASISIMEEERNAR